MKVLHLISGGDTGGAKTHLMSLIKGLNKIIDARIICFIEDDFYQDFKKEGIQIQVYQQKNRFDMSVVHKLVEEIEREDYDLIHCHGARANFISMFLKKRINKPLITTIHSDYKLDFKDNLYKRLIFTTINTIALKRFDYYIAISNTFKDMLIERGFKSNEIYIAYNGIDIDRDPDFQSKEEFIKRYNIDWKGETLVGIVARLDQVKDHETFIKAASLVLKEREDVLFLIAGDGNDQERLKALVKDLGLEGKILFLGFIQDPYSFFNAIDINTLTSISESFPYVILEGSRMKKTIISTKVGGLIDLIKDGYNGYLVDIGHKDALAARIISLLDNKEMIKIMGENLYKDVKESFSSHAMAERHIEIYEEIMEGWKKRHEDNK